MNAELLKQAAGRLARTETREAGAAVAPLLCADSADYRRLMAETHLEATLGDIGAHSFRTALVPLSRAAAAALLPGAVHAGGAAERARLAAAVDAARAELGCERVFVRLSTRSPKDAPLALPHFARLVRECRARLADRRHALLCAAARALACCAGADAVALFCASARVRDDLRSYVAGDIGELNVCVREFEFLPVELEFRAFVYRGRLTALTQYNPYAYFELVARHRELLRHVLVDFCAELEIASLDSYVLDLALVPLAKSGVDALFLDASDFDGAKLAVRIVELNPLAEFAGEGLFSWETDRAILLGTASDSHEVEFRVVESAAAVADATEMAPEWRAWLEQEDEDEEKQ